MHKEVIPSTVSAAASATPNQKTESTSEPAQPNPSASARSNYLIRHWRGEFSLAHSYWVNSVAIVAILSAASIGIKSSGFTKSFDIRMAGWWALGVTILWFLISVWSSIGVWRSADAHVSRGGQGGWATTAKVLIMLGLLRLGAAAVDSAPMMNQSLSLAFGHDTMPASQLRVLDRATEVEIAGGISFGTANALTTILDATPTIRLVQLNNSGGWIDEGLRLGQLVEARKLATYTARECDSACLLVFLAGTDRYLGSNGKLGFNEASIAGKGGENAKEGTDAFREALDRKGAPEAFITHALSTPPSSIWYPTQQELLAAHVITAVVDEQKFGQTGVSGWRDRVKFEREFAGVPLFAAVAQAEPETYERLKENYIAGIV